jgi:hypothetical protein
MVCLIGSLAAPLAAPLIARAAPAKASAAKVKGKAGRLLRALTDPDARVRASAAKQLGRSATAKRAGPVLRALKRLLGDKTAAVRLVAVRVLSKLAPAGVFSLLRRYLADPDRRVRRSVTRALARERRLRRARVRKAVARAPVQTKVRLGDARGPSKGQIAALRLAWQTELRRSARLALVVLPRLRRDEPQPSATPSYAYELGSRITRDRFTVNGARVRVSYRVEAWLSNRKGAMLLTTTGSAEVELTTPRGPSPKLRRRMRRQALSGAVSSARRNLERFLARRVQTARRSAR